MTGTIGALALAVWLGGFLAMLPSGCSIVREPDTPAWVFAFVTFGWPISFVMSLAGLVHRETHVDVE